MGLCKCPLKKVTNLFCFEHRVNVCESCLVTTHSQCVVQTYLKWLQDSEYSPECKLCTTPLSDAPTVRLLCLHLFHKHCLTKHALSLPPTTAPAAYTCTTCQDKIFPDPKNNSPIAESLRSSLATETWARPGLGLPVELSRSSEVSLPPGPPQHTSTPATTRVQSQLPPAQVAAAPQAPTAAPGSAPQPATSAPSSVPPPPKMYAAPPEPHKPDNIPVGIVNPVTGSYDRTVVDSRSASVSVRPQVSAFDCDEDKYRRRSLREWVTRWLRLHTSSNSSKIRDDPLSANLRRWIVLFVIGLTGFLTLILILTRVSYEHASSDPFANLGYDNRVQINPK